MVEKLLSPGFPQRGLAEEAVQAPPLSYYVEQTEDLTVGRFSSLTSQG